MEIETEVISAFRLWNCNLISDAIFFETMHKIKGIERAIERHRIDKINPTNPINPTEDAITERQKNYILKLIGEGKIPKTQSLNLTKLEAQILIQHAVLRKPEKTTLPANITSDTEDVYDENHMYL